MRQVAPDLLLYPISDVGEALARVPHREVVDPPPQHWIDQAYHPLNQLRPVSAKYLLELPQQRRPLFELGRVMRPHHSAQTAEVASNPRKPKFSPRSRSTLRLFSSLISTCRLANSSRSRLVTA